jgi:hypothetical protein
MPGMWSMPGCYLLLRDWGGDWSPVQGSKSLLPGWFVWSNRVRWLSQCHAPGWQGSTPTGKPINKWPLGFAHRAYSWFSSSQRLVIPSTPGPLLQESRITSRVSCKQHFGGGSMMEKCASCADHHAGSCKNWCLLLLSRHFSEIQCVYHRLIVNFPGTQIAGSEAAPHYQSLRSSIIW